MALTETSLTTFPTPKSVTRIVPSAPRTTLAGRRSPWKKECPWAEARAVATPRPMRRTSSAGRIFSFFRRSCRQTPRKTSEMK